MADGRVSRVERTEKSVVDEGKYVTEILQNGSTFVHNTETSAPFRQKARLSSPGTPH
jgi:hypothetical protein